MFEPKLVNRIDQGWINVTENVPLYSPGGLANGLPSVSVPPILIMVREGDVAVAINGLGGSALPIVRLIVPPLLPVSVTSGPFKIVINVPGSASTSKIAGENENPCVV